jgi:hypothetical protein
MQTFMKRWIDVTTESLFRVLDRLSKSEEPLPNLGDGYLSDE